MTSALVPGPHSGALLVDKPAGCTSFDVVRSLRRAYSTARDLPLRDTPGFGHGGTLDPFATGLLVVFFGEATKLAEYFLGSEKSYSGTIRFGAKTESGDLTNPVIESCDRVPSSLAEIEAAAREFLDRPYLQTPPMFSAKKQNGVPLHELARAGKSVERDPVSCRVHALALSELKGAEVNFEVRVSAGTFIRVLAEDLAARLGTLAHLTALRRTGSGSLSIAPAQPLEGWLAHPLSWTDTPGFLSIEKLLGTWPKLSLTSDPLRLLRTGQQEALHRWVVGTLPSTDTPEFLALEGTENRRICGILKFDSGLGRYKTERVFASALEPISNSRE